MVLEFYELEFHKKFSSKFEDYLFKELELMELELHSKLEFQKSGRSLHISKTYFQNSGKLIYISVNSRIWPFWPMFLCGLRFWTTHFPMLSA